LATPPRCREEQRPDLRVPRRAGLVRWPRSRPGRQPAVPGEGGFTSNCAKDCIGIPDEECLGLTPNSVSPMRILGKSNKETRVFLVPEAFGTRMASPSGTRQGPPFTCSAPWRSPMRAAPTRQRFSGFILHMVNGSARSGARAGLPSTRAGGRVLVLLAILLAAHAGGAHAADGPFIPIDLGTLLGGSTSFAYAVNDSGQVVGFSETAAGGAFHAFLWTAAGGAVDLGTLGGRGSEAHGVNASGQVVGFSETVAGGAYHAFSWTVKGGMIDLGTLGGSFSVAEAVNDSGEVVGCADAADGSVHAFSWTAAGGMVDLGTLGNASEASGVNASGQVVGSSEVFLGGVWD